MAMNSIDRISKLLNVLHKDKSRFYRTGQVDKETISVLRKIRFSEYITFSLFVQLKPKGSIMNRFYGLLEFAHQSCKFDQQCRC